MEMEMPIFLVFPYTENKALPLQLNQNEEEDRIDSCSKLCRQKQKPIGVAVLCSLLSIPLSFCSPLNQQEPSSLSSINHVDGSSKPKKKGNQMPIRFNPALLLSQSPTHAPLPSLSPLASSINLSLPLANLPEARRRN